MGKVNRPSNLLDRIKRSERELQRLWKAVGLSSATIARGGLTLLRDSFLRMVDDNDTEIVYIGPDSDGKQAFRLRRESGTLMFRTAGSSVFGRDWWEWTDSEGRGLVADDAETGVGLARPWIPVVMYRMFDDSSTDGTPGYSSIPVSELSGWTRLWEGTASIWHPWIRVGGVWGAALGTNTTNYRLLVNGEEIGAWSEDRGAIVYNVDRFDVRHLVGTDWANIQLEASATGDGRVACQVLCCFLI